ncbi:zinc ribbon domain-containing protein [Weizmannia sp. FSL W8-0401]|uniref:zinc ribbon domain-containing protein n=1 Tax=Weizmannia sp. FSL W8-0401 TaxID=2954554 RepID=UPI0030FCC04A
MGEIQERVGEGLNKIQDQIYQGKKKLQTVQQLSRLQKQMQETGAKRAAYILQLGEEAYREIRNGSRADPKWLKMAKPIAALDKTLYHIKQVVQELNGGSEQGFSCPNCGAPLTVHDKFCGSCGAKVELQKKEKSATVTCPSCEEQNIAGAHFCTCCGTKLEPAQEGEA